MRSIANWIQFYFHLHIFIQYTSGALCAFWALLWSMSIVKRQSVRVAKRRECLDSFSRFATHSSVPFFFFSDGKWDSCLQFSPEPKKIKQPFAVYLTGLFSSQRALNIYQTIGGKLEGVVGWKYNKFRNFFMEFKLCDEHYTLLFSLLLPQIEITRTRFHTHTHIIIFFSVRGGRRQPLQEINPAHPIQRNICRSKHVCCCSKCLLGYRTVRWYGSCNFSWLAEDRL